MTISSLPKLKKKKFYPIFPVDQCIVDRPMRSKRAVLRRLGTVSISGKDLMKHPFFFGSYTFTTSIPVRL